MSALREFVRRGSFAEMIRAPKGRANKAQANGLGPGVDRDLHSQQALKGRNNPRGHWQTDACDATQGLSRPFSAGGGGAVNPHPGRWLGLC